MDLILPDGSQINFGQEPRAVMAIRDPALLPILTHPTLGALGEAFVDGRIDITGDMMTVIASAERLAEAGGVPITARINPVSSNHTPDQDRADITHHYDVGNEFYRLWLDERMVYSCAYFETGKETIDEAQRAKLDHICRKLRLQPGEQFWISAVIGVGSSNTPLSTMAYRQQVSRCRTINSFSRGNASGQLD